MTIPLADPTNKNDTNMLRTLSDLFHFINCSHASRSAVKPSISGQFSNVHLSLQRKKKKKDCGRLDSRAKEGNEGEELGGSREKVLVCMLQPKESFSEKTTAKIRRCGEIVRK